MSGRTDFRVRDSVALAIIADALERYADTADESEHAVIFAVYERASNALTRASARPRGAPRGNQNWRGRLKGGQA